MNTRTPLHTQSSFMDPQRRQAQEGTPQRWNGFLLQPSKVKTLPWWRPCIYSCPANTD
jgi:hypothetical protein